MRLLIGSITAVMLLTSGNAYAKDKPADGPDKLICKRVYDADTGSHFTSSKRVCRTAADWKDIEDQTTRSMKNLRDHGDFSPGNPGSAAGGPR